MGFWDSLGKLAGEIVEKGVNDFKKAAENVTNLREDMENYSEAELVSMYKNAKRTNNRTVKVAAKSVLRDKYGYQDWQFDGLDF